MNQRFLMFFLSILMIGLVACGGNEETDSESEEGTTEETKTEETEVTEESNEGGFQILEPVTWSFSSAQLEGNKYQLTYEATIDEGWYVYSQYINDGGPIPTAILHEENDMIVSVGQANETSNHMKDGYDEMFDMDITKYAKSVVFSQTVEVSGPTTITGYVEYMTCDSIQCLFPDPAEFEFNIGG